MQEPGFWDDPSRNASLMQQRRGLERRLETLNRLRSDAEELATWRELLDEGEVDEAGGELQEGFGRARRKVGETIEDIGEKLKD